MEETALGDSGIALKSLRSPAEAPGSGSGLAGPKYCRLLLPNCLCFSCAGLEEHFNLRSHQKGKWSENILPQTKFR